MPVERVRTARRPVVARLNRAWSMRFARVEHTYLNVVRVWSVAFGFQRASRSTPRAKRFATFRRVAPDRHDRRFAQRGDHLGP